MVASPRRHQASPPAPAPERLAGALAGRGPAAGTPGGILQNSSGAIQSLEFLGIARNFIESLIFIKLFKRILGS